MPDPVIASRPNVVIHYNPGIQPLEPEAERILAEILTACEIPSATVTSTGRTVQHQAEVMFANCLTNGSVKEKGLYKEPGNRVIEVYEKYHAALPREAVIS